MDQDPAAKIAKTVWRLIRDVFSSVICLASLAVLLGLVGLALLALPVFLGCWLLVRLIYWLITRVPMWLDMDRINTGRIHRWPYIGNLLLCLAILAVAWFSLRYVADTLVRAYGAFLWGKTPEWMQAWLSANADFSLPHPWLDPVVRYLKDIPGLDRFMTWPAAFLCVMLILATFVVLRRVVGDADRLRMIEKA
jgi:hypothetical protein